MLFIIYIIIMWHEITINAETAGQKLDAMVALINWMADTGKGCRLSVDAAPNHDLTVSFWDEDEYTPERWRRMLDESYVLDGYEYEIK